MGYALFIMRESQKSDEEARGVHADKLTHAGETLKTLELEVIPKP
jgi:hypothetical protein